MLTKNEKASAIQFAMDFELGKFGKKSDICIEYLLKSLNPVDRWRLINFWKKCCPLTYKVYAEWCYLLDEAKREKSFFKMTNSEKVLALFCCIAMYLVLAMVIIIWS